MKQLSFLFCLVIIFSCKQDRKDSSFKDGPNSQQSNLKEGFMRGKTMGTSYSIKYLLPSGQKLIQQETVDSILVSINDAVSTYVPTSTISRLNKAGKEGIRVKKNSYPDQHFVINYSTAAEIFVKTNGFFDPSVMPLVNYWGFGYEGKDPVTNVDTLKVQRYLKYVGMNNFATKDTPEAINFTKNNSNSTLDFSAIAKGYAVDYLASFLEQHNINAYMVEIGGEINVKGINKRGDFWKLGVNTPEEYAHAKDIQLIVTPKERSLASSGNYRIFHTMNDVSYGHEINPKTGFPHKTDVLSASVIHDECMYADAYATAFMIMGLEKTIQFANNNPDLEVCLIIKEDGKLKNIYSEGFMEYVVLEK